MFLNKFDYYFTHNLMYKIDSLKVLLNYNFHQLQLLHHFLNIVLFYFVFLMFMNRFLFVFINYTLTKMTK